MLRFLWLLPAYMLFGMTTRSYMPVCQGERLRKCNWERGSMGCLPDWKVTRLDD
ncbi:hypothetical protein R69746_07818 [Paraburkholderia aspalathi]|nr:hypothetical protein R69746_07818 [Paraburkholderia aspalathi]